MFITVTETLRTLRLSWEKKKKKKRIRERRKLVLREVRKAHPTEKYTLLHLTSRSVALRWRWTTERGISA